MTDMVTLFRRLILIPFLTCCFLSPSSAETVDITMGDSFFDPPELTVSAGDTVRWTHNGFLPHTTTSGTDGNSVDGIWDSGPLFFTGQTFSFTFDEPGTFPYHCSFHWNTGMKGTITVEFVGMPLPTQRQGIGYSPVVSPLVDLDPLLARPVGIGPLAIGGLSLDLQVALHGFDDAVDIYGAYTLSTDPDSVQVLMPGGRSFQGLTFAEVSRALSTGIPPDGVQPWISDIRGPVNERLFNTPVVNIPDGTYTVYLLVTLPRDISAYYLWITNFTVP